jgi:prepilin-type N-terminal cleavage/methylation domain-containing protein
MISLRKIRQLFSEEQGFTLIETIVSVLIFGIIATGVSGVFAQTLLLQRRGNGAIKVQENALFAMELMAREIRVSQIVDQDDSTCGLLELTIEHPVNGTVRYYSEEGKVMRSANGVDAALTSPDVNVSRLQFCVTGSTVDLNPSRVAVILQASNLSGRTQDTITFDLQTTIVSRDSTNDSTQ